jgi:hypothetical protein
MLRVLPCIAVVLVAGCSSPGTVLPPLAPAGVSAGVDKTWNAVIDILSEKKIAIKTLDKSSGYVLAEVPSVGYDEASALGKKLADCGGFMLTWGSGPLVARYSIVVHGDSTESSVKIAGKFTTGDPPIDCPSTNAFEAEFQSDVKARAEGR